MMYFFFQAEDGIRDGHVTGVQTCALPISVGIGIAEEHLLHLRAEDLRSHRLAVTEVDEKQVRRNRVRLVVGPEIGRASCRERVEISVGAAACKQNTE